MVEIDKKIMIWKSIIIPAKLTWLQMRLAASIATM
jgi:hypothetical protein